MRLLTFSLLLFLSLWGHPLLAQIDSTAYFEGEEYNEKLQSFIRSQKWDSAIWAGNKSIEKFTLYEDWPIIVQANVLIANCYSYKRDREAFHQQVAYTTRLATQKVPNNREVIPYVYNLQAIVYKGQEDYQLANEYFLKAAAFDSLPPNAYGSFYSNLGFNYRIIGDYGEAIRYYEYGKDMIFEALAVESEKERPYLLTSLARSINKIARTYRVQAKYEKALAYYHEVDSLYRLLDAEAVFKARIDCAHSMAYCYIGQKRFAEVPKQLARALALQGDKRPYQEEVRAEIEGELAFSAGDINTALQKLEDALNISLDKNKPKESLIRIAQRIAEIYSENGAFSQAQKQLTRALAIIAQGGASQPEDFIYPGLGIPLLAQMAELQTKMASQLNETMRLDSALQLYQRLKSLIRYNRNSFKADNSRLFLASQTLPIYEKAIRLCYQRFQVDKDQRYLEEAYSFSELGKATLLREALRSNKARNHFSVPDSLQNKERSYQIDIAYYKEQLFLNPLDQAKNEADSSQIASWQEKLFGLENQYRQLSEQLEKDYPRYYEEKYAITDWTLQDLQKQLSSSQLLIEYFWGQENLYIFKIGAAEVQFEQINLTDTLNQALQRVQSFLSKPNASELAYAQYQGDAYVLYRQLIAPLDSRYEELIIIPDGPLGYLAFDALLTEKVSPEDQLRYHELPYLLKKYRLHYQYSSAFLLQSAQRGKEAPFAYGGFAPSYAASPNAQRGTQMVLNQALAQLAFTKEEVLNTHAIWGGKTYLDEAATKEVFLQEAAKFKLLHLAMHGLLSGENTEFAALAFHPSSDSAGEFLLSMEEIAAMELAAELVVLSACETGAGRLRQGEGIMSMARAFREAGCPNILMSLWTADDKSSTLIMQDFFNRLKSGDELAEAIRAAKLELMNTQFLQSHPYYWAGFVPLGKPQNNDRSPHLLLIGIMVLLGAGLALKAYQKE
ncbi:MAG: CHAT domain-containing tetratricopeptide repeat protein [Bacteroidota bacterium]